MADETMTAATSAEVARDRMVTAMAERMHTTSDHGRDGVELGWLPICNCREKAKEASTALEGWGSECVACGNTTPQDMVCDNCGSSTYTVLLVMDTAAYAEKLALAEGVTS